MAPRAESLTWEDRPPAPRPRRSAVVPSSVLAMQLAVIVELMFFSGLISAWVIAQAANPGAWPPPGQPRLPMEATAFNTLVLLVSGALVWRSGRLFAAGNERTSLKLLLAGGLLGAFFVLFQGFEWLNLLREGLTLNYSTHGAFFYLIVGMHALHAILALGVLTWTCLRLRGGLLTDAAFWTVRIFWFFVVGLWPVLYALVYLT